MRASRDNIFTNSSCYVIVFTPFFQRHDRLKDLEDNAWKSRISEPKPNGILRWKSDDDAKRAYYNNRARLLSGVARQAFKLRAELVERSFALALDRGGMRRAWLRGQGNLQKRYLVHVSGYNLGLIMRLLTGFGTPRRWADANIGIIWLRGGTLPSCHIA